MQSVISILADIRAGKSTAREAVEASLDAIAACEPDVLAFERTADRAALLRQAETATGPLAGIAIGVKDIFDTFDMETQYGTRIYAGNQPKSDAAIVAMARRAGGAIVGKTVSTEFAYFTPGKTRNPHDPTHTPGGSSSGSAAAVAAGMIPAAIGTQTGGSIIRPASFCGVAGYKPSFRLLPATGMKTFSWSLDTVGLFAASVADVAAFAAALTGRPLEAEPVDPASLRIGIYRSAIWNDASEDMRAAVQTIAALAADAGATVMDVTEPDLLAAAREAHATIQNYEAGLALAGDLALNENRMSAKLRETLLEGTAIAPSEYDAARRIARHARHAATELFSDVDILIKPSAPGAAPKGLETTGVPTFNKLWSLAGNPCVNVPGIADAHGLPLGVQIVARFGQDQKMLSVATWLQSLLRAG
jgi:Asp-tRNA(Asn)/Glu-tRNA(Gln) amidotransferase A subunit family amidase